MATTVSQVTARMLNVWECVDHYVPAGLSSAETAASGLVATNMTSTAEKASFPGVVCSSSHFIVMVTKLPW